MRERHADTTYILTRPALQLYAVAATLIAWPRLFAALAASPETEGSAYQNTRYLDDFSYLAIPSTQRAISGTG